MINNRFYLLYIVWAVVVVCTFLLTLNFSINFSKQIVEASSRAFFQEIVATRSWNSSHGGVYVIVSEKTQPNPYLEDSLRDLSTTTGIKLTKVNPAFMTRQISEVARKKNDIIYHITSLNPIRPQNSADSWERKALESFERGDTATFELVDMDTASMFRYMAPLKVEKSCLNCHAKQGYSLGQIRGGISVTTPSSDYYHTLTQIIITRSTIFLSLLLIGIFGIFFFQRMVKKQFLIVQNQNKTLTAVNLEKDRLFSIIAHDLRSPLSGIQGLSKVLLEEKDGLTTEESDRIIGSIARSSENVLKLSEHLILWYQTRKGIQSFNPEYFNINAIVDEVIELSAEKTEKKEIIITTSIPDGMQVYADLNMIETIFRNLIGNALKFTPHGGKIEISAKNSGISGFVEISVEDNGIGMDQQTIDHLFEHNFNISKPGTDQEEGTGLGLAICHEFIAKNNGAIRVESTLDIGSRFILTLPSKE
ncbi:MAG: DUF3365 domain-containing protein [Bacteroidales bacterium]|nr:DUF3365 domain-containing protein [Bacteroidales bacterium]